MNMEAVVLFDSPHGGVPLGILRFSGERVDVCLCDDLPPLPYSRDELEEIVQQLIELPIRVWSMRRKMLPQFFDEVQPGSAAHFLLLQRRYGPFSIVRQTQSIEMDEH